MNRRGLSILVIILLLALGLCLAGCNQSGNGGTQQSTSVYDGVIKSGVIRAAYLDYPPACMKDPKTGKLKGIFVETLEKAAENCGLKVEWTEEVGWGSQIEGLQTGRYDIVGSPVWANSTRGKMTTLSIPLYYSGIGVYVRNGENRFTIPSLQPDMQVTTNMDAINSPKVKIATIDGETGDLIARTSFPLAQRVSSPQNTDISQKFLDITGKKADVFFAEPYFGYKFLQSNPDTIKNIAASQPIRTLGNCYMMKRGEFEFKHMIDTALDDLLNSGFVDAELDKYEPAKNTFYRVARPYRIVK